MKIPALRQHLGDLPDLGLLNDGGLFLRHLHQ
jgi:hypothetical protein